MKCVQRVGSNRSRPISAQSLRSWSWSSCLNTTTFTFDPKIVTCNWGTHTHTVPHTHTHVLHSFTHMSNCLLIMCVPQGGHYCGVCGNRLGAYAIGNGWYCDFLLYLLHMCRSSDICIIHHNRNIMIGHRISRIWIKYPVYLVWIILFITWCRTHNSVATMCPPFRVCTQMWRLAARLTMCATTDARVTKVHRSFAQTVPYSIRRSSPVTGGTTWSARKPSVYISKQ